MLSRPLWLGIGLTSLACGAAGAALPLIPATPFLLLAAYAFARSSPRLHTWLLDHPHLGPVINDWRHNGSIARPVKLAALATIIVTLLITMVLGFSPWIIALQAVVLTCVAVFIVTRPDGVR